MVRFAFLALMHVPLGLMLAGRGSLATLHALVVLVWLGLRAWDHRRPERLVVAAAYLTGCDVLWRMTGAVMLHQMGKYGLLAALLVWVLRSGRSRGKLAPVAFVMLLVPSVWAAGDTVTLAYLKGAVSFNLSGPFALAACVLFFRQFEMDRGELARALMALIAPAIAVWAIAVQSTVTAEELVFTNESNYVTSGGFGPNQVSSLLGLGAMLLLLFPLLVRVTRLGMLLIGAGVLALGLQAALTFSRGGLYGAVGALLVALPFLLAIRAWRGRVLAVGTALAAFGLLVMVPRLEAFTEGQFANRMGETRMAGREELMLRDLELWNEHPVLGVGPGMSQLSRYEQVRGGVAHTEYTRLLAEHGFLGILAALLLLVTAGSTIVRAAPGLPRALTVCFLAWSALYMVHAAMRLAAPAFVFGLAVGASTLVPAPEDDT